MRRLRPRGWKQWCGAIVFGVFACGVCSIIGVGLLTSAGILPDTLATQDAQTQVAENDRATARWLTATAVTFTPTDTSTDTPTATDTPTSTFYANRHLHSDRYRHPYHYLHTDGYLHSDYHVYALRYPLTFDSSR